MKKLLKKLLAPVIREVLDERERQTTENVLAIQTKFRKILSEHKYTHQASAAAPQ
ncbi:hypothetical protein LX74_03486 [Elizabethkingia miricola]|uniref:Uncharacterized protein n=1 Tax=Elizabethkingia miricola TaxID=172045 RepID=A0ABY3NC47_ELIMR|nr:hypothetical protein LX74_03486 [Elizabethkingia miricola]